VKFLGLSLRIAFNRSLPTTTHFQEPFKVDRGTHTHTLSLSLEYFEVVIACVPSFARRFLFAVLRPRACSFSRFRARASINQSINNTIFLRISSSSSGFYIQVRMKRGPGQYQRSYAGADAVGKHRERPTPFDSLLRCIS
jgi:hypothetical protein